MDSGAAKAKEVFLDALETPEEERAGLVARACAGDERLLARVRSLLAAHAAQPRILRTGLGSDPAARAD